MITIEEVKKEYFRISKKLNCAALTYDEYRLHCKEGYTSFGIRKYLDLSWNQLKKKIDAPIANTRNIKGIIGKSSVKIECLRGGKHKIYSQHCIVDCNDVCKLCLNRQERNIKASDDTLTQEQETLMRHEGIRGAGYAEMIESHAEI